MSEARIVRRRVVVGFAIALSLVGLVALKGRRGLRPQSRNAEGSIEELQSGREAARSPEPGYYRPPVRRAPTYAFGRPNPVIDRILVDKTEVCRGEENFVHVDLSTVDDSDADLKVVLQGTGFIGSDSTGRRLPMRLLAPRTPEEMPTVVVFGRGGTFAEQQVPSIRVKDCDAEPFLGLDARKLSDQGPAAYQFEAVLGSKALSNVVWSFGDGETQTTQGARVTHDYGQRPQQGRFSEFLISATGTDEEGRTFRGYRTLELVNRDYIRRRTGT